MYILFQWVMMSRKATRFETQPSAFRLIFIIWVYKNFSLFLCSCQPNKNVNWISYESHGLTWWERFMGFSWKKLICRNAVKNHGNFNSDFKEKCYCFRVYYVLRFRYF